MSIRGMFAAGLALLVAGAAALGDERMDVKVLYAGNPGSDRERDFKGFLETNFARVGTASYETFQEKDARDYDVVILDWTSIYPRDESGKIDGKVEGLKNPTPPRLTGSYARPTILIGA